MIGRATRILLLAGALIAAPAMAWTPHSAAALLDASFPTADACQHALDSARRHEQATPSEPVHGLSYARLFEQGRCAVAHHDTGSVWRIRMHWVRRP